MTDKKFVPTEDDRMAAEAFADSFRQAFGFCSWQAKEAWMTALATERTKPTLTDSQAEAISSMVHQLNEANEKIRMLEQTEVVVTKNSQGQIVAVTRQNDEGQILEVIAESDVPPAGYRLVKETTLAAVQDALLQFKVNHNKGIMEVDNALLSLYTERPKAANAPYVFDGDADSARAAESLNGMSKEALNAKYGPLDNRGDPPIINKD